MRHFADRKKPIAAICHGSITGRLPTPFADEVVRSIPPSGSRGDRSRRSLIDVGYEAAHVDGNFITAAAWPAHPQWLARFLEV